MNKNLVDSLLSYDSNTGIFIWKKRDSNFFKTPGFCTTWNKKYAGKIAGTKSDDSGYVFIPIFKQIIRAHHLAWITQHGICPDGEIDHINGLRHDNRIINLRSVTKKENAKNKRLSVRNKSGFHGVYLHRSGKYRVRFKSEEKLMHLGYFVTLGEAVAARKSFEAMYGYHKNHGVTV